MLAHSLNQAMEGCQRNLRSKNGQTRFSQKQFRDTGLCTDVLSFRVCDDFGICLSLSLVSHLHLGVAVGVCFPLVCVVEPAGTIAIEVGSICSTTVDYLLLYPTIIIRYSEKQAVLQTTTVSFDRVVVASKGPVRLCHWPVTVTYVARQGTVRKFLTTKIVRYVIVLYRPTL